MTEASMGETRPASRFEAWATSASRQLALIGLVGLACQAFLVLLDVSLRWVVNAPVRGLEDAIQILVAISLAAFFPVAMAQRENVSISVLNRILGRRGKALLDVASALALLLMTLVIAWQVSRYAGELYANAERTTVLNLPLAPGWIFIAVLLWFTAAVQGLVVLSSMVSSVKGEVH